MKHVYMANNGTIFNTELQCIRYEAQKTLVMFAGDNPTSFWDSADIVFIKDYGVFWDLDRDSRMDCGFIGPGWYVWSQEYEKFICWDEVVEAYNAYKNFIEGKMKEGYVPDYN